MPLPDSGLSEIRHFAKSLGPVSGRSAVLGRNALDGRATAKIGQFAKLFSLTAAVDPEEECVQPQQSSWFRQ
jgi:hypothetical protein